MTFSNNNHYATCLSIRKYIGQVYTDSLVHDENALKYLVTTMGEDNVVLGTDYPFPLGELHPGKLIESIQDWPNSTKVYCYTDKYRLYHEVEVST